MFRRKKHQEDPPPPLPASARPANLQRLEWGNTYMEEIVFPSGERLLPSGEIVPPSDNHKAEDSQVDTSAKEAVQTQG